ncbi:MAG: two pore domain potassium channel family protein [Anaerolineales bacterium]|nr:two pore domain potassium channel family protein [Anaerolineales bacterium]
MKRNTGKATAAERKVVLRELIEQYEEIARDTESARQVRQSFLQALMNESELVTETIFADFLVQKLQPEDFSRLHWEDPDQVIALCEILYGFQFSSEAQVQQIKAQVQTLLRHALQQFEQQGDFEKMFLLLHLAPTPASLIEEGELFRLRNRAYLYETRRIQRIRRFLYAYLVLYVVLVIIVFPFLFINAENGALQNKIEQTAEVDMPEERRQFFSYADGLYWSLITAGSIGYGDITPITQVGRIIAATLGVMGVITVGVIAGLILEWITPRRLD